MKRWTAVLVVSLAACSMQSGTGSPEVELREFSIDAPATLSAGPTDLTVTNRGEFGHMTQVTSTVSGVVATTALIPAGESTTLELDLAPGEYQFTCRIVVQAGDGSIVDHYQEGMTARLVVEG
jgi:hypothetical protein